MSLTAFGILLSLCMGLRIGELCGLKWEDVDFQHKILHIRRTVQRITSANGNRKTKIVISAPKSATSFRDIAISESLMKYFRMFRDVACHYILSGADKPVEPRTTMTTFSPRICTLITRNMPWMRATRTASRTTMPLQRLSERSCN